MQTVSDILDRWPEPKVATFGRDIGVTVEHAATMRQRNSIPVKYWMDVVAKAGERGIEGINYESLAVMHGRKEASAA